jgi:prolyl-tRNA editing enzyme YbaK/EbsC (Cys-tRNA(Pro) deacylase)
VILFDTFCVSAGKIGAQVELKPDDLIGLLEADVADVVVNA